MAAPLRWRRIGGMSGALVALAVAVLVLWWWMLQPPDRRPPPFHSRPASDTEQIALVDALRRDASGTVPSPSRALPMVDPVGLSFCPGGRRPEITDDCGRRSGSAGLIIVSSSFDLDCDARPGVHPDFRRALIDANLSSRILPIPPGSALPEPGVEDRATVPDGVEATVLHVTRAVISQDGTQALIHVEHRLGRHHAWGALVRLRRTDGQWRVQNTFGLWMT
jgi:hypothetical protein